MSYDPNYKARIAVAVIKHAQAVAPESKTITITVDIADELRQSFERVDSENQDAREALRLIQWYLGKEGAPIPESLGARPRDLAQAVGQLVANLRRIEKVKP